MQKQTYRLRFAAFRLGAAFFLAAFFLGAAFFLATFFLGAAFFLAVFFFAAFFFGAAFFFLATFFLAAFFFGAAFFFAAFFFGAAFFLAAFFFVATARPPLIEYRRVPSRWLCNKKPSSPSHQETKNPIRVKLKLPCAMLSVSIAVSLLLFKVINSNNLFS